MLPSFAVLIVWNFAGSGEMLKALPVKLVRHRRNDLRAVQRQTSRGGHSRQPRRGQGHVALPWARPRPKLRPDDGRERVRSPIRTLILLRNLSDSLACFPSLRWKGTDATAAPIWVFVWCAQWSRMQGNERSVRGFCYAWTDISEIFSS